MEVEDDDDDSSDSSDDEDEKPAATKETKVAAAKKEESSSDDDSSDDEEEEKKPAPKAAPAKAPAKKEESSDDESSSDDEEEEKKPAPKAAPAKAPAKKEESSDDDSSDDEEDEKPAAAKPAKAPAAKKEESSDDDSSDDEEDEKPAAKSTPKAAAPKKEESSDDDDSSDDDSSDDDDNDKKTEAAKPAPKPAAKKEEESSSDEEDSSEDEEEKKPAAKVNGNKKEESEDDEPEMKVTNNKNKSMNGGTPGKSPHNKSNGFGDQSFGNKSFGNKSFNDETGRKIFIHNVSEEATYEDFQEAVEKHGEVTDFFNPGRGFAFITYSTNEEAQACIAANDNTNIAGRDVQMNIAKPKGERGKTPERGGRGGGRGRGGGGGFGGRREEVDGAKLFVHNVSEETSQDDLYKAFGKHGNVTDTFNPGRGFAFVTYSTPDEAQAAIAAMNGTHVCGRDIECNIAKPRRGCFEMLVTNLEASFINGEKGETMKHLKEFSEANIKIIPAGFNRNILKITGDPNCVETAKQTVTEILNPSGPVIGNNAEKFGSKNQANQSLVTLNKPEDNMKIPKENISSKIQTNIDTKDEEMKMTGTQTLPLVERKITPPNQSIDKTLKVPEDDKQMTCQILTDAIPKSSIHRPINATSFGNNDIEMTTSNNFLAKKFGSKNQANQSCATLDKPESDMKIPKENISSKVQTNIDAKDEEMEMTGTQSLPLVEEKITPPNQGTIEKTLKVPEDDMQMTCRIVTDAIPKSSIHQPINATSFGNDDMEMTTSNSFLAEKFGSKDQAQITAKTSFVALNKPEIDMEIPRENISFKVQTNIDTNKEKAEMTLPLIEDKIAHPHQSIEKMSKVPEDDMEMTCRIQKEKISPIVQPNIEQDIEEMEMTGTQSLPLAKIKNKEFFIPQSLPVEKLVEDEIPLAPKDIDKNQDSKSFDASKDMEMTYPVLEKNFGSKTNIESTNDDDMEMTGTHSLPQEKLAEEKIPLVNKDIENKTYIEPQDYSHEELNTEVDQKAHEVINFEKSVDAVPQDDVQMTHESPKSSPPNDEQQPEIRVSELQNKISLTHEDIDKTYEEPPQELSREELNTEFDKKINDRRACIDKLKRFLADLDTPEEMVADGQPPIKRVKSTNDEMTDSLPVSPKNVQFFPPKILIS